jgi:nucleotide-binding universal stress UspA family protein
VTYEHVLAVVDGSREAERAIEAASLLAGHHGARLTLAAVIELERQNHHCGIGTTTWNEVLRDAARADLDRAGRMVEAPADQEILYGSRIDAVATGARALGCDLIVVPGPPHGITRILHRDRTSELSRRAGCEVIAPG